ncbi:carbohydrate-binding domain-containing protein [Anaerofustis stercorihominis]|uniref:carbohydrate-binding domain-containing protein n=1 Tax=Anaerofustis stercorihominis TaxID=214853 RepID=UPI00210DD616|nr:carbohydrate-binding domain-containing protein [Anaerofustis stercorihominis]MCQ4794170.1 carbohydrate-binding domain-containing protein [Anaerofustis stercorihominis]
MKTKRKIVSLLVTVCMMFLLMPAVVLADTNYLAINTVKDGSNSTIYVTDTNASDVLGDGTVSYNKDTNTLTLNNCNLAPSNSNSSAIYVYTSNQGLNLVLNGTNTITGGQCMYINGDLNISGSGTLTATGTTYAVMATGNVTIDGVTVNASTTGKSAGGVQSHQGSVTIKNATVNASAENSWGLYGNKGVSIENSTVTAKSTCSNNAWAGLSASSNNIVIKNSNVTAESAYDHGIAAFNGDVEIIGGTVNATSTAPGYIDNSGYEVGGIGIAGNNVTISGANVTATATGAYANAICGWESVSIKENAEVTAKTTNNDGWTALWADSSISVSKSKVTVEAVASTGILSDKVEFDNSEVTATGYWQAVKGTNEIDIKNNSSLDVTSTNDVAIWAPDTLTVTDSVVNATGKENENGVSAQGTTSVSGSWVNTSGNETFDNNISDSVLFNGTSGNVIGNATVPRNVTIVQGATLTIPDNTSLTVPEKVTLTNNGTIVKNGTVTVNGTVVCASGNHIGGTATCKDKAVCEFCGTEYGDLDASNHTHIVKTEAKEATHLSEGNIEYWSCEGCGTLFKDANGTEETTLDDTVIAKLPEHTKDNTGLHSDETNHWNTCECGAVLNKEAHTFKWVIDKEATVDETGSKHEECSVCGYKKSTVEIPKIDDNKNPTDTDKEPVNTEETTSDNPQTGDDSNILPYMAAIALTVAIAAAVALTERRKKHN